MIARFSLILVSLSIALNCGFIEASICLRKTPDLNGLMAPVFTPFKDGTKNVDYDQILPMAKYLASKGIFNVLLLGAVGEGYTISENECKLMFSKWTEAAKDCGIKTCAMVGDPTPSGIRLAKYAASLNFAAIFVLMPLFTPPRNAEVAVENFKLIADEVKNTPVILYIDPNTFPKCVRTEELYYLLTKKVCNFAGVRSSLEVAQQIRAAGLYQPDCQYSFITNQYSLMGVFCLKYNTSLSLANTLVPEWAVAMEDAGCGPKAFEYQEKTNKFFVKLLASPRNYIPRSKVAFECLSGIKLGGVRPPLVPATCEERKYIAKALQEMKLEVKCPVDSCDEDYNRKYPVEACVDCKDCCGDQSEDTEEKSEDESKGKSGYQSGYKSGYKSEDKSKDPSGYKSGYKSGHKSEYKTEGKSVDTSNEN